MIAWTIEQRGRVDRVLRRHPVTSDRCARAARSILKTATEVDSSASALVITPEEGTIFVQPKGLSVRWYHHVTVSVTDNYVDVLTGPDGHEQQTYLEHFFTKQHGMRPIVTPDDWEGL